MIFRCSDQGCGYFGEGPRLPEFCPRCGKRMLQAAEGEMTGDDWSALGVFWISRPNGKERGLACFRRSAGMGSGWGTCNLGICMEQGLGVEAAPRQAFWLYQQAVEMGSLSAVCNLGVCYEQGIGTTSDQKKAVELFRRAAEHGSSRGQRLLARCLEQGLGLPQDQKAALEWLRTSALQGDASSQAELARHYEFGVGTEISPKQAVQWYRRAAQAGDADGQCCLGWLMEHGKGGAGRGRRGPALFAGGGAGAQPGRSASGDLLPQWDRDAPGPRPGLGPAGPGMGAGGRVRGLPSWDRCA